MTNRFSRSERWGWCRRVATRIGLMALFVALLVGGVDCRSAPPVPESGHLLLELSPANASVVLDERPLLAPRQGGGLRVPLYVGAHRVEVFAPGYFAAYRDVAVSAAGESRLQITLRADPDAVIDTTPARAFGPRPVPLDPP